MQNPLSKDVMLADEVGMSKTIEVARVLCQLRAVAGYCICPAALRKQWARQDVHHIAVVGQVQRHAANDAECRMAGGACSPISQSTCEEFPMKELVCFAIGLVIGAVVMKKSQAIDELKKELDRERFRNSPSSSTEQI